MAKLGVDMSGTEEAHFTKTKARNRSMGPPAKRTRMDISDTDNKSLIRSRSLSKPPRNEQGIRDVAVSTNAISLIRKLKNLHIIIIHNPFNSLCTNILMKNKAGKIISPYFFSQIILTPISNSYRNFLIRRV